MPLADFIPHMSLADAAESVMLHLNQDDSMGAWRQRLRLRLACRPSANAIEFFFLSCFVLTSTHCF
jgi:hypothetical protein